MSLTFFLQLVTVIFLIGDSLGTSTTFRVFNETVRKHVWIKQPQYLPKDTQQLISRLAECRRNNCTEVLRSTAFSNHSSSSASGLVRTVVSAYSSHTKLVLRPDDIWAAIMIQFSLYVNKNPEEFRDKFVIFTGKKELEISLSGSLRNAPYDLFIQLLSNKIDENLVDPNVKKWLLPNFSTTTGTNNVAIGAVFLTTFKKYFGYKLRLSSAISYITLEGTVEDWKDIQERLEKLKEYNLEKWYDMLYPVIGEFIKAKEGQVDLEFWKRIVHHRGGSGSNRVSGWITVFSVFDSNGNWQEPKPADIGIYNFCNETHGHQTISWLNSFSKWPRIDMSDIQSGIVEVDRKIDDNGVEQNAVLFAGHIVAEVLKDDVTLQPVLSWVLTLKNE